MENILSAVKANIQKVLVGEERVTSLLLTALVAGGHVLIEDVPGMGKTVLARSLAKSVDGAFGRIQFTPDLLPSDVTGLNFFDNKSVEFQFSPGPVFCNILLADEINRATPCTQSALLECMAEGQVTVDGETRRLAPPFFVIATQNPVETLGTYPLPEAQLDRFLMRLSMDLPTREQERQILERFQASEPLEELGPVCKPEEGGFAEYIVHNTPYSPEDILRQMVYLGGAPAGTTLLSANLDSGGTESSDGSTVTYTLGDTLSLTLEFSQEAASLSGEEGERTLQAMAATFAAYTQGLDRLSFRCQGEELTVNGKTAQDFLDGQLTITRTVETDYRE